MALSTPISVSGLSSGLDTEALIEKLNEANSLKIRRLQTQKANIETTRSAFTTLGEKLNTLLAKAETLAKEQTYDAKTVTVSKPDDLTVTATTSGISGNYAISEYQRSTQSRLTGKNGISNGSLSLTTSLNSSGLATAVTGNINGTAGSFTINGATIGYEVNESMSAILSRINNSEAGVTALYDKFQDRMVLTSKSGGSDPITVADTAGSNFLAATGVIAAGATNTAGTQARMKIDGLNNGDFIYSNDDIFTEAETGLTGLTISIKKNGDSADVGVATDTAGVKSALEAFNTAYNDVLKFIRDRSKVSGTGANKQQGVFYGDQSVQQLQRQLRNMAGDTVEGQPAGLNYLGSLGVGTISQDPSLSFVDPTKLDKALGSDLNAVKRLMSDSSAGLMTNFASFVKTQATSNGGIIRSKSETISDRIEIYDQTIERENTRVANEERKLRAQFAAMEKATSQLQGSVTQLLGNLSS